MADVRILTLESIISRKSTVRFVSAKMMVLSRVLLTSFSFRKLISLSN